MNRPFGKAPARVQAGWLALAAIGVTGVLLASHGVVIGDEGTHLHQVRLFAERWAFDATLTTVPGWHALAAALLTPLDEVDLHALRLVTAAWSLPALWVMHALRRQLGADDAQRSTAQLLLLPVLFPFWFLAYTDAPALALLLLALLASVRGRHGWAALALAASLLVRQHLVFWGALLAMPLVIHAWEQRRGGSGNALRSVAVPMTAYVLVALLFCAWWAWNGAIAFQPAEGAKGHPDLRFGVGNPLFLLAVAALLLPLHCAVGMRRFVQAARRQPAWLLLPAAVVIASLALFRVEHPYNHIVPGYYLRNGILLWVEADPLARSVFTVLATFAACGLSQTVFFRRVDRWLLPLALLFVSASWLIETRYTIVPLALWLALRRPEASWIERTTLGWWLVCSGVLLVGMLDLRFMP